MKRAGILNALVTVLLVGTAVLAAQVRVVRVADIDRLLVDIGGDRGQAEVRVLFVDQEARRLREAAVS